MNRKIVEGFKLETITGEVEKLYFQRAFEITAGNKMKMERLLGVSRQTIEKKIKKYGIC